MRLSHCQGTIQNEGPASQTSLLGIIIVSFGGKSLILKCSLKIDKNKYTVINKKYRFPFNGSMYSDTAVSLERYFLGVKGGNN